MKVVLTREASNSHQTIGLLEVFDAGRLVYTCHTLELPWLDNQSNISCIPTGTYEVQKRFSQKYQQHFHVQNVIGRAWILIHAGNFHTDTRGCILPGKGLTDINADGYVDVTSSNQAMQELLDILPSLFELTIR